MQPDIKGAQQHWSPPPPRGFMDRVKSCHTVRFRLTVASFFGFFFWMDSTCCFFPGAPGEGLKVKKGAKRRSCSSGRNWARRYQSSAIADPNSPVGRKVFYQIDAKKKKNGACRYLVNIHGHFAILTTGNSHLKITLEKSPGAVYRQNKNKKPKSKQR